MPTLDDIKNNVEAALRASTTLPIDEVTIGLPDLDTVIRAAIDQAITLSNASLRAFLPTRLVVTGEAEILGGGVQNYQIVFTAPQGVITVSVRLTNSSRVRTLAAVETVLFRGRYRVPSRLAGFAFRGFDVVLTPDRRSVLFQAPSEQNLPLIGSEFVVTDATIELSLTGVGTGAETLRAKLTGNVAIGSRRFITVGTADGFENRSWQFEVNVGSGELNLQTLATHYLIPALLLPNLEVFRLGAEINLESSDFLLRGRVLGQWTVPFGLTAARPLLRSIEVEVQEEGGRREAALVGTLLIAGETLATRVSVGDTLTITGRLESIDLDALCSRMTGRGFPLPRGFPRIEAQTLTLSILLRRPHPRLVVEATTTFGTGFVILDETDQAFEFVRVAGFILPTGWRLSDLSGALSRLASLDIQEPALVISSIASETFDFPPSVPVLLRRPLRQGVSIYGILRLETLGLGFLRVVLAVDAMPLVATVTSTFADFQLTATLAGALELIPRKLSVRTVYVTIRAQPLTVEFGCVAEVTFAEGRVPALRGAAAISEQSTSLTLATAESWVEPFGIRKLTINRLAVKFDLGTPPQYALLGDVVVAGNQLQLMVAVAGNVPTALSGNYAGALSLPELLADLVGLPYPAGIPLLQISNIRIHVVGDPRGIVIDGERFDPGIGLRAVANILGLEGSLHFVLDPDRGVFAEGALADEVVVGPNVLVITNAAGDGPPFFQLETRSSIPSAIVSGRFSLLGLQQVVSASVSRTEITFVLSGSSPRVNDRFSFSVQGGKKPGRSFLPVARTTQRLAATYRFECRFAANSEFGAAGEFQFEIDEQLGPLTLSPSGPPLGTIHLAAAVSATASISYSSGTFVAFLGATFSFAGQTFTIANLRVESPPNIGELPEIITRRAVEETTAFFTQAFESADAWLEAVGSGLVTEVVETWLVLRDAFGQSAADIAQAIRDVLGRGSTAAARALRSLQETALSVARLLRGLGDGNVAAASAMLQAEFGVDEVRDAIIAVFGVVHLDYHGDSAAIPAVRVHTDVGHGDAHGDAGHGDAHGDAIHGDTHGDLGHGDVHGDSGHADFHGDVHADAHGDSIAGQIHFDASEGAHGDANLVSVHGDSESVGVHADSNLVRLHADSAQVGIHGDSNAVGLHADTEAFGHGDAHGDVPPAGHADTVLIPAVRIHTDVSHGDAHGDAGHGDAHGDIGHGDAHGDAGHGDAHGDAGHGDAHGDFQHGDTHWDSVILGGPHADWGSGGVHGDSGEVGIHADTNALGVHADNSAVGVHADSRQVGVHADSAPISQHVDTPEVLHGDVHADVPAR
ncbi:hypothetical protein VT84_12400 [Gemmata sp. SH-PL17]|uniref:hypothetical protein n=1 Tax=Gemmata sp. SH-PL17 TaxID=1630693 RepID=UPI00078D8720|nr:hypothetical protein [Gemmata sp. SH-PL17]AMV25191.1 hypothetical protein VT84_12400 [Gemmata sp. SH-PL17]